MAHITYKWMTFEAKDISDKVRCYWECLGEPFKNLIRTQWEYFANRKNPQKSVPTPETQKKKKQYQVVQGWMVDECRWNWALMEKERNWLLFWSFFKALPLQQDSMFLVHTIYNCLKKANKQNTSSKSKKMETKYESRIWT